MLKKTITYEDYNGTTRTEDFYFNLSKSEVVELEVGTEGGFETMINTVVAKQDRNAIIQIVKKFILSSYGIKSADGRRFEKSDEIRKSFEESEAFVELFMELINDGDKLSAFFNGILPKNPNGANVVALPQK